MMLPEVNFWGRIPCSAACLLDECYHLIVPVGQDGALSGWATTIWNEENECVFGFDEACEPRMKSVKDTPMSYNICSGAGDFSISCRIDCEQFRIDSETMTANDRDRTRLRNKQHRERLAKFLFVRRILYYIAPIS
jgi:hypothetical protein